jgi:putative DNA primase/helicase
MLKEYEKVKLLGDEDADRIFTEDIATRPSLRDAALIYARAGFAVFPVHYIKDGKCSCGKVCNSPGKHPMTAQGFKDATTDLKIISEIWDKFPDCNIGLVTGLDSGIVVVDVDMKSNGFESLKEMDKKFGSLPTTLTCHTGGGGCHFFFKYPINHTIRSRTGIYEGIDIRANGGYVVAAPSLHSSGNRYKWNGSFNKEMIAEIPVWLIDLIEEPRSKKSSSMGGRNDFLASEAGKLRSSGFELDDLYIALLKINQLKCNPPLDDKEVLAIARSISKYEFSVDAKKLPSFADIAELFVDSHYMENGELTLRSWSGRFYHYKGTNYSILKPDELKNKIFQYMQRQSGGIRKAANKKNVSDILSNVEALVSFESKSIPTFILRNVSKPAPNLIVMSNGILDLEKVLIGDADPLTKHSPSFFCLGSVPYPFDPKAVCPTWLKFLYEMQPDPETVNFLQEWMGYNLVHDTSLQKFLILVGEGANGKSVYCSMLKHVLGESNVSSVGLENFDVKRSFQLAYTQGKLANIVGDLNEIDKAAEGLLKNFVAGESLTVEQKFGHPFELIPTARLTFACNSLPHFCDRSDGIWRRMIVVPFRIQILDANKQDARLLSQKFWLEKGELPGIFNWAVEGLRRLRNRGKFVIPNACITVLDDYKLETNPARAFLMEHFEYAKGYEDVGTNVIYKQYAESVKSLGHNPVSAVKFAKEVKRVFKEVKASENARLIGFNERSRVWINLRKKL